MATTSTSTLTVEMVPMVPLRVAKPDSTIGSKILDSGSTKTSEEMDRVLGELGGNEPNLTPTARAVQKWNEPIGNACGLAATFFSFLVMGANDAAYGVCRVLSMVVSSSLLTLSLISHYFHL